MMVVLSVEDPKKKKVSAKMIIILLVAGLLIISICTCFSWKLIVKRTGNIFCVINSYIQ